MNNNKEIYLSNIEILSSALFEAIEECKNQNNANMKYVYAYLFGTIGAISSFFEFARTSDKSIEMDGFFQAVQYAFNLLKHNPRIATLAKLEPGKGMVFPFSGPIVFTETEIIWISEIPDNKRDKNRHREAYISLFAGRSITETIHKTIRRIQCL